MFQIPQARQPYQKAIEDLEEIQPPPFLLNDWDEHVGAQPMICSCVLAGESIRKDQWETQQFHRAGMHLLSVLCDHCALACTIPHTSRGTTVSPYLKQYYGQVYPFHCLCYLRCISVLTEWRFPLITGRPPCLLPMTRKSFLPCAYFVPKRAPDAPPKKGIKLWGSVGF